MKKTILFFIIVLFFYQCNSQKKELNPQPMLEISNSEIPNQKYFVGKWYNTETYYVTGNNKKLQSQSNCQSNSYWDFQIENDILKQSKFTAKGKNCSEFISTHNGSVIFTDHEMQYFVDDVMYSVTIKVISDQKFILMTKDFIGKKNVVIEKTYEKK
ncbi:MULTISPECIES: hypothetical protein [unclassified Kaistella]|uniref:hypothetical protein n=1 Tax=unclassified Kaistella TaxID=2762626 RepID=UPI002733AABF|nr:MULTISPECIES: hypothetical protein [unclassified Kaistella]MDP2454285.1 hypothetical protein [Kaistella sp. SH11-4b]MDP2457644.1 hypothetical protein [Kaistella sp. SH40-3]MDP2460402.1 hypothetical protein [Kaistella sp. SH19-2b]